MMTRPLPLNDMQERPQLVGGGGVLAWLTE